MAGSCDSTDRWGYPEKVYIPEGGGTISLRGHKFITYAWLYYGPHISILPDTAYRSADAAYVDSTFTEFYWLKIKTERLGPTLTLDARPLEEGVSERSIEISFNLGPKFGSTRIIQRKAN